MKLNNSYLPLQYLLLCLLLIFYGVSATAGSNPRTKYESDPVNGVGYFDLVVSLDWNPDQSERYGRLQKGFEQFAQHVFMMTEGKHKIRKLYVYTNSEQMSTADIKFESTEGGAWAKLNGFRVSGLNILFYDFDRDLGAKKTGFIIGNQLAMEFAHYVYGLYDEYRMPSEDKYKEYWKENEPCYPHKDDNTLPTIMGDTKHPLPDMTDRFSTATDYDKESNLLHTVHVHTAQWRCYQSSAWETLVRSKWDDFRYLKYKRMGRTYYQEFSGMIAPTTENLTQPVVGWDLDDSGNKNFNIEYMDGSVAVLVIDDSGSMSQGSPPSIDVAKSAAKQFVDLMNIGEKVAVVGFDSSARTEIGITELADQAAKDAVKAAIDSLVAGGGTNFTAALTQTQSILSSGTTATENRYVVMMSDGEASQPDTAYFEQNNIPIYTIGLGFSINATILQNIASPTNGSYTASPTSTELNNIYAQLRRDTAGNEQLAGQFDTQLAPGAVQSWTTPISSQDGATKFSLSWDSGSNMNFTLSKPDGTIITPSSLPAGVTYVSGATYAIYNVVIPGAGNWTGIGSSASPTSSNVTHEVTTESMLSVGVTLSGGTYPEPIAIAAAVNAPETVVDATVIAQVTPPAGTPAVADINLRDDGVAPDWSADDGIYTGVLADYSANGDYDIKVVVTNPDGQAKLGTGGAPIQGTDAPAQALPEFSRYASGTVTATNVRPLPSDSFSAQQVVPDNTTNWGAIAADGAEVWYKFYAVKDVVYYIQTSNLLSWDVNVMATRVVLYGIDATTELTSSEHYIGTDVSYIEWMVPADGTYFIKVSHASPGTGVFGLTAGTTSVFTTAFDVASSSSGDVNDTNDSNGANNSSRSSSGGGGGSIDPVLLLMIWSLLYLTRRRCGM